MFEFGSCDDESDSTTTKVLCLAESVAIVVALGLAQLSKAMWSCVNTPSDGSTCIVRSYDIGYIIADRNAPDFAQYQLCYSQAVGAASTIPSNLIEQAPTSTLNVCFLFF